MAKIMFLKKEDERNLLLSKNLTSLALFGLWPFQSKYFLQNRSLRRLHYRIGLITYCLFFLFFITECMELVKVWGNLEDMTTNISVSFLSFVGGFKIFTLFSQRKKMKSLVSGISFIETTILKHQDEENQAILYEYLRRARKITYFFWTLTASTITVFFIIPLIEYRFSSNYHRKYDNGTEFWSYVRPMIFSSWFPFDKYSYPNYLIAYVYQMVMGGIGAAYQAIWDMFIISMMIHSIGQLQILQRNLKDVTENNARTDRQTQCSTIRESLPKKQFQYEFQEFITNLETFDEIKYKRLVNCVKHHRYILRYTYELNAILRPVMMLYFMVCSLMLCAIGFQASLYGFSLRLCLMVEYLIAMMIQLLLFCWHGNEVVHESDKLLLATYSCKWYNESEKFKKSLWIMREGIKLPIRFTVGPFYTMSLPTFLAILRASYSYFALLRQIQEEKP